MDLNLDIYNILDLLKASYKNIDFRSAIYNKGHNWQRILSIFRFSNETKTAIKKKYNDLNLKRYNIKNFKIQHEILEISKWEGKLLELYNEIHEDIEIHDIDEFFYKDTKYQEYQSSFLDQFKDLFSTPSLRFFFTEEEVKHHNLINFFYSVPNKNKHHIQFNKFLNEEILILGEDNIYDVINRTMQLDGYNSQNGLYISIVFPIYMKINELNYTNDILSGKIQFHEIFEKTKIFFRIYSNPNYYDRTLKGREEAVVVKDAPNTKETDNGYYETIVSINFKEYDCDPNFEIRALWEKLPKLYLIDFQKSFGSPRFQEFFRDLTSEEMEENDEFFRLIKTQESGLNYKKPFIRYDFKEYGLGDYESYINLINRIAYHNEFFVLLPILIRCVFENLLYDILSNSLPPRYTYFYYNEDRGRVRDFGVLIDLLNLLSGREYKKYIKNRINEKIIKILKEIKEDGNLSVHEITTVITRRYSSEIQEKINIALEALLASYKRFKKEIVLTSERELKIRKKLKIPIKEEK